MKEIITNNFQETQKLGQDFARRALESREKKEKAVVVALEGDLGSGKTTFVQGMAQRLGIKEQITSPTFVLMKNYEIGVADESLRGKSASSRSLFHIDCYRLEKPWQLQELGFEEIINNPANIVVIEWAEKVEEILPKETIKIKFEFINEGKRKIDLFNGK